ncbi:MAG: TIGR02677 family protein [Sarcina sp.]
MFLEKEIKEATYLNTQNTYRYRKIIRCTYQFYQNMKYWVYAQEIYKYIKEKYGVENYTENDLKVDLDALTKYGNFQTIQDTKKTRSIEEFKNRKFRYQISPVTIELERAIITIENLATGMRGSLEISLMERFKETLLEFEEIDENMDISKIFSKFKVLQTDFRNLNENYQDYLSRFSNPDADEILKTTEFLIFKESFMKYLNDFVSGIQVNFPHIFKVLKNIDIEKIKEVISSIVVYEKGISIKEDYNEKEQFDYYFQSFISMREWFLGSNGTRGIAEEIIEATNEIIRKITRYALAIAESNMLASNRNFEYKKIIEIFNNTEDEELSYLSSVVFGVFKTKHIFLNSERETESIESRVFDEKPEEIIFNPKIRTFKEKTANRTNIKNKKELKEKRLKEILLEREKEKELMQKLIVDNKISFETLGVISVLEKKILLNWISRAIASKNGDFVKNEFGMRYKIQKFDGERLKINCVDGLLDMPRYELIFAEEE